MNLISERTSQNEGMIMAAFQRRILKKHADKISQKQDGAMPNFKNSSNANRTFEVDDDSLIYRHKGLLRMVEIKRLTIPKGTKKYKRAKTYPVHNRIIMGHFGQIGRDLTFGFSDQIRDEIMAELDGKIIG